MSTETDKIQLSDPTGAVPPPPNRFTVAAKADWASTPETVRADVLRLESELLAGLKKHQAAAARDADLAEFHEMAAQTGKALKDVVAGYVDMERTLRADPVKGFELICQTAGISLRDVAAQILGRASEETATADDPTVELVTKFAEEHPRLYELSDDIVFFIETGRAADLAEAYSLAKRFSSASSDVDLARDGSRPN